MKSRIDGYFNLNNFTLIIAGSIQLINEKLIMVSMLFMSLPINDSWTDFLAKMETISPTKPKRVEKVNNNIIALIPFLLLSIFLTNDVIQVVLHYLEGRDCLAYIMFYISNNYIIFTCIFLSKIMNILNEYQKELIHYMRSKRKNIFCVLQEVTHIKNVNRIFKSHCQIVKYLNELFGWRLVFIFTGCIIYVSNFAPFFFLHYTYEYGNLLTLTDCVRIVLYLVS